MLRTAGTWRGPKRRPGTARRTRRYVGSTTGCLPRSSSGSSPRPTRDRFGSSARAGRPRPSRRCAATSWEQPRCRTPLWRSPGGSAAHRPGSSRSRPPPSRHGSRRSRPACGPRPGRRRTGSARAGGTADPNGRPRRCSATAARTALLVPGSVLGSTLVVVTTPRETIELSGPAPHAPERLPARRRPTPGVGPPSRAGTRRPARRGRGRPTSPPPPPPAARPPRPASGTGPRRRAAPAPDRHSPAAPR